MVEEMIRRFDKNEECRCLCLDKILDYYGMRLVPKNSIKKIDNFIKTYRFLKQKGFLVEGYIDKRLLINPKFFLYLQKKILILIRIFLQYNPIKIVFICIILRLKNFTE